MKTYSLAANVTVTAHIKVKARSKAEAMANAESACFCLTPLFYPGAHDYEKPTMVQVEGGAWLNAEQLDNQIKWEHV